MSEQAAPEPTMEEILASIRRIISEDDAPAAPAPAPAPVHEEPAAAFEPAPEPEPAHEDVLELTQRVDPPAETVGDLDVYADEPAAEPEPEPVAAAPEPPPPAPKPAPAPAPVAAYEPEEHLVSEPSATLAASAFGSLSAAIAMPAAGVTLEDVTRELLRPLLKAWLDEHLPRIVEAKVAEEVERISRTRVR
jgi:cell pole-organizing protein PopZ